jgi:MoxR-like ATPase
MVPVTTNGTSPNGTYPNGTGPNGTVLLHQPPMPPLPMPENGYGNAVYDRRATMSTADIMAPLRRGLRAAVQGRDETIDLILISLLADGHVLLEDHPGSGKTTMARALGSLIITGDTEDFPAFRRIQFTPDLLPTDITGVSIFEPATSTFHFRRGPLFAHILLADEINRTSPKVQAALLEAMGEKQVTVEDRSLPLDELFMVIATQNPYDAAGTYPLPAAQLDRFLFKIRMDYLTPGDELLVLRNRGQRGVEEAEFHPVTREDILYARHRTQRQVMVSDRVHICLVEIATMLRRHSRVAQGPSTRSLVLMEAALKAAAALEGRDYVAAEDIRRLAGRVFTHRILLNGAGRNRNEEEAEKIVIECMAAPLERLIRSSLVQAPMQLREVR